jgi:ABC-type molybdenum transport system ATPase subunit/photorepair protein PhrA
VLDDEPALDLTADAWVALGLHCAGRTWPAASAAARDVLERAGLGSVAGKRFGRLTRGQRYALALARGLARSPHLLLVDWAADDGDAVPEPLHATFAAFLANAGACLVAGGPGRNAVPAGGRVETLDGPPGAAPAPEGA